MLQIKSSAFALAAAPYAALKLEKDSSPNYQTELHAHATQLDTSFEPRQHLSCCLLVADQEQRLCACRRTVRCSQTRRTTRPTTKPSYMRMLLSLTHRVDENSTSAAICLLQIKGGGILNDAHHTQLSNSKDNSPNYQIDLHAHATQLDTSCGPRQHLSCHLLVADQRRRSLE